MKGGKEDLGISRLDLCMHTSEDSRQKWKQSDLVKRGNAAKAQQAPVPPLTIVFMELFLCHSSAHTRGYFEHAKVFYIHGNLVLSIKF